MLFGPGLRSEETEVERRLWQKLRDNRIGDKFRRQVDIGPYVVDFCCFPEKLIIELDGQVHKSPSRRKYDDERTKYFESLGYRVMRFWNGDVKDNIEGVVEKIRKMLVLPHLPQ